MMPSHSYSYDCLVIGGGVLGASIFYHLAKAGVKVALLEKNTIASGCTAKSGGIVRCFHMQSELSDMAIYSWHYYKNFYNHTGQNSTFNTTGFLYFPDKEHLQSAQGEASRLSKSIPIEWLEPSSLQKKFGDILYPSDFGAIYEPGSGYMNPVDVTRAWIKAGLLQGGQVYENTEIQQWDCQSNITLQTRSGIFSSKKLIIATGAHTPRLLSQLGFSHDMYAQMIQVDVRKPTSDTSSHPAYIDDQFDLNGRCDPGREAMYIGHPTYLRVDMPDEQILPDLHHTAVIEQQGRQRWRWVEKSSLLQSLRAADCYTPNGDGRVYQLPGQEGIYVASGFSGGGFKMAPWVGNRIAQLVTNTEEILYA